VFIALGFMNCSKEDLNTTNKSSSFEKNRTSHLVFADSAAFLKHLNWVSNNLDNPDTIVNYNSNCGFTSAIEIYDAGADLIDSTSIISYLNTYPDLFFAVTLNDSSLFYELPYNTAMAYIINKDAEFQIGSQIIKAPKYLGQYSYRTVYFTSNRRIVGRLYESPEAGLYTYDARTTSQVRKGKIWWQTRIEEVGNYNDQGIYYEQHWGPYKIDPAGYVLKNKADMRRTIVRATYRVDFSKSSCLVNFKGKRDGISIWIRNEELFPDNLF